MDARKEEAVDEDRMCRTCTNLRKEYENVLKNEAVAYARVIAHRNAHRKTHHVPHMRLVNEIAKRYTEGNAEALEDLPSA